MSMVTVNLDLDCRALRDSIGAGRDGDSKTIVEANGSDLTGLDADGGLRVTGFLSCFTDVGTCATPIFVRFFGCDRFACSFFQKSPLSDIVPPCRTK